MREQYRKRSEINKIRKFELDSSRTRLDLIASSCKLRSEPLGFIKGVKSLDQVSDCQLGNKALTPTVA